MVGFTDGMIDRPILERVKGFNQLSSCFTLQGFYGHFDYDDQQDRHNLESLPGVKETDTKVAHRIAYIAFCIENSTPGRALFNSLKTITTIEGYIQFCFAQWFGERQINSYALQVEPDRFKRMDTAVVDFQEALHIEKVGNEFFLQLYELLEVRST